MGLGEAHSCLDPVWVTVGKRDRHMNMRPPLRQNIQNIGRWIHSNVISQMLKYSDKGFVGQSGGQAVHRVTTLKFDCPRVNNSSYRRWKCVHTWVGDYGNLKEWVEKNLSLKNVLSVESPSSANRLIPIN
jgi:hypothetical protein